MKKSGKCEAILAALALMFTGASAKAEELGWGVHATVGEVRADQGGMRQVSRGAIATSTSKAAADEVSVWELSYSLPVNDQGRWGLTTDLDLGRRRVAGPGLQAGRALRWETQPKTDMGALGSWLASERLEFHGAYFRARRFNDLTGDLGGTSGSTALYQTSDASASQLLGGIRWAARDHLNLTAEAWYDGSAPSDAFWGSWIGKPEAIRSVLAQPGWAPTAYAIGRATTRAGIDTQSLRRTNMVVRSSWRIEGWEPGVDVIYTPMDGGLMTTAKVVWQRQGLRIDAGARFFGGRQNSLYALVPVDRVVYVGAALHF